MSDRRIATIARNPTAGYQPQPHAGLNAAAYFLNGEPWFTWDQVPLMTRDNAVAMGLKALRSPFPKIQIARDDAGRLKVQARREEVRRYVAKTWAKFWKASLPRLLDYYFRWGRAPGGNEWEYNRASQRLDLTRVRPVFPFDAMPYTWRVGRNRGSLAGFELRRGPRGGGWVGSGNAFWFCGHEALGPFCDEPRISTAFAPWHEKNAPAGLRQARRVSHFTRAVGITVVRYPEGTSQLPDGTLIANENRAVQLGLTLQNGTIAAVPNHLIPNSGDKFAWDIDQRRAPGDGKDINDAVKDADEEIWFGMGIPPEILRAGGVGSGYSGRAIPMEIWLSQADELAHMVDEVFRRDTLTPGVRANFGKADYDYELTSLLEEYLESQKSPGGPAPSQGGQVLGGGSAGGDQWQDDGMSSRGTPRQVNTVTGAKRYGAQMSGAIPAYLSDLPEEDETAAKPEHARALRYAMLTMAELGAVHGFDSQPHLDALADLAHDPDHLGALLGAADLSWLPYHGPRGGVGAKSDQTGRVIYGKRAQLALEAQARRGTRQASADRARELVHHIATGAAEDHPKHFEELAHHLPALTREELRDARKGLKATFQNGTRREQMVSALHEHARAVVEGRDPPKRKTPDRSGAGVGVPNDPKPGRVYEVPTDELNVDPDRFQFKLNTDASGVTKELKSVKTFNPEFGGVIAAWKDPEDGKSYVVNGHHRHELASRTGHPSLAVRYIQAGSAKEARAVGALINMAEGRGTAVDAAKFMRDSGVGAEELEKRGVSLHGRLAEDATALTSLSDKTFDKLARGDLDHTKALAVAKNLPKPELQDQLFRLLDKREESGKDLPLKVIEEMAREMGETPTHTTTESTLFGDIEDEESLFVPRNELKAAVRGDLAKELNDFSAVASSRRAGAVAGAGNVLNLEENKKRADAAAEAKWTFDQLANRSGAISTALNEGAAEYVKAKGKKGRDDVRQKTADKVREAIRAELAGLRKPDPGAIGSGDEGGVAASDGERGGAADEGSGDPGTSDVKQPSLADVHRRRELGGYESRGVEPGSMDVTGVENGAKQLDKIEGQLKAKGWVSAEELTGRNPKGTDVRRTSDLLKPLVDSGHLQMGWNAEGYPHYALAGTDKPAHITTDDTPPGADEQPKPAADASADPAAHLDKLKAGGMKPGEWYDRDAVIDHLDDGDPRNGVSTGDLALGKLAEAGLVEVEAGKVRMKEPGGPDPKAAAGDEPAEGGKVSYVRAPVGGKVSEVDGKFYAGGQLMPVHGLYSGRAKPEPAGGVGGGPVEANPDKEEEESRGQRRPARELSPEEIEERRDRERRSGIASDLMGGPLNDWGNIAQERGSYRHRGVGWKSWKDYAESVGEDKLKEVAAKLKPTDPADLEEFEYQLDHPQDFKANTTKKHLAARPTSPDARMAVDTALRNAKSIDDVHAVHKLLTSPVEQPATAEPDKPADDVARDLFGRPIAKKFGKKAAVQPTIEDAMREAWVQRGKEYAAEHGLKVDEWSASGRFRSGNDWYEVGKAEDGHPVTKVGGSKPAPSPAPHNYDLHNSNASRAHESAVRGALKAVPDHVHSAFKKAGGRVAVARRVTDHMPHLKNQRPRGWPDHLTWDHADGLYHPETMSALSTEYHDDTGGGGEVKSDRAPHVVLHEYGHGIDHVAGILLHGQPKGPHARYSKESAPFRSAYEADVSRIPNDKRIDLGYFLQGGDVGPEEAFAEAIAGIHGHATDPGFLAHFPKVAEHVREVMERLRAHA